MSDFPIFSLPHDCELIFVSPTNTYSECDDHGLQQILKTCRVQFTFISDINRKENYTLFLRSGQTSVWFQKQVRPEFGLDFMCIFMPWVNEHMLEAYDECECCQNTIILPEHLMDEMPSVLSSCQMQSCDIYSHVLANVAQAVGDKNCPQTLL